MIGANLKQALIARKNTVFTKTCRKEDLQTVIKEIVLFLHRVYIYIFISVNGIKLFYAEGTINLWYYDLNFLQNS